MAKRWRIRPFDVTRVAEMARAASVPHVVAQLLLARGVETATVANAFLQPKLSDLRPPETLPGVELAADIILRSVRDQERITVYGDYDADGITATAILVRCLKLLGATVDFHIPNRLDEGYGLNSEALRKIHARGTRLVITVDCGITSCDEARLAHELGMRIIISDHHEFASRIPEADAVVHPRLPNWEYPFEGLCGAGVALKLAWQLCRTASNAPRVSDRFRDFLLMAVGLAALGTVADVVPLVDENRLIVRHGLDCLKERGGPGIRALLTVCRLHERPRIDSEDIAFGIAPRINAAGRLGQAEIALELLLTDSDERASELANYLHELNTQRDSVERSMLQAALKMLPSRREVADLPAIVLGHRGWHPGVLGIVAGRIAERFARPCVLVAFDAFKDDPGVGSGRSALGVNLHRALSGCAEQLVSFGGHAAAAGLRVELSQFEAFRGAFVAEVDRNLPAEDRVAELRIDAESPSQLTLRTVDQIEQLAPFGHANPRPLLCATEVEIVGVPKHLGQSDKHMSLQVRQQSISLRCVAFGQGEWVEPLKQHQGPLDIAYRPVVNEFAGRRTVELRLVDWRPTGVANEGI